MGFYLSHLRASKAEDLLQEPSLDSGFCIILVPLFVGAIMAINHAFLQGGTLSTQGELIVEGATIAAGLLAVRALWCMSFTIINYFFGQHAQSVHLIGGLELHISFVQAALVFGGLMTVLAIAIDRRTDEDYAFWAYLFGVTSLWAALTSLAGEWGELGLFGYFVLNVALMLVSVPLQRLIFVVLGGFGALGYLFGEAFERFHSPDAFIASMGFLGASIVLLAVVLGKNHDAIEGFIWKCIPASISRRLPSNRR